MKKILFIAMLAFVQSVTTGSRATNQVDIEVHFDDPVGAYPVHRSPSFFPGVYIDGHTLSFDNLWGNYTLTLYDEEGDVAYTACLPAGTTQIVLPTTLSGNFEIRLEADTYYYYGYILL
jgi:hypothetical protein